MHTYIYFNKHRYFLPEDGDEEQHPNVYLARKPRQPNQPPLLRDIKSSFPLPGTFHFRFKSSLVPGAELYGNGKEMPSVWMDCVDDNRPVPVWKNSIIAKVTRISLDEDDLEEEETPVPSSTHQMNGVSNVNVPPPAPVAPAVAAPPPTENLLNVFDTPAAPPAAVPAPTSTTTNLFDMDAAPSNHSSTGSLLDIPTSAAPASSDLLGMSMGAPPAPAPPTQNHFPQASHAPMPPQQHYPQNPYPAQPNNIYPQQPQQRGAPMNGSHHSHTNMNGSGHAQRGNYGNMNQNKKENGFDSFANKQGPFGNLNWG